MECCVVDGSETMNMRMVMKVSSIVMVVELGRDDEDSELRKASLLHWKRRKLHRFRLHMWVYGQIWITLARFQTARSKHRILDKRIEFEQVDRERN
ncbi:hypothetical protein MKW98_016445, partial [Papaver atlanticum]